MRNMAIALLLTLLAACGTDVQQTTVEEASIADRSSPFGLWSTERGQTVEVFRDGTFRFCDGELCETGQYERYYDRSRSVFLIGFGSMTATQRLRKLSGWQEELSIWQASGFPSDVVSEHVRMLNNYQLGGQRLCQGRPCSIVGRVEGDVYRFVKLRDY